MTPTYLITMADIVALRPLSSNTREEDKVKPHVWDAQEFDLRPFLGDQLYLDLLTVIPGSASTYDDLWGGSEYTYNGKLYKHEGLKTVLIYYAYARIIMGLPVTPSPFDMVQKTNEFSRPLSDAQLMRPVQQAISGAKVFQERVELFLNRNIINYNLWRSTIKILPKSSIKITGVGGRSKVGSSRCCRRCGRYSCVGNCY